MTHLLYTKRENDNAHVRSYNTVMAIQEVVDMIGFVGGWKLGRERGGVKD